MHVRGFIREVVLRRSFSLKPSLLSPGGMVAVSYLDKTREQSHPKRDTHETDIHI